MKPLPVLASALALAACATAEPPPRYAQQAAECMGDVLKQTPGYVDASIATRGNLGSAMTTSTYSKHAASVKYYNLRVELHGGGGQTVSLPVTEGVTRPLFEAWRPCGVTMVDIASS